MTSNRELVDRIRGVLRQQPAVREVRMFGGLSFMVNEKLAIAVSNQGDLMLRCDPEMTNDLLAKDGAQQAEMRGKPMGKGWVVVSAEKIAHQKDLDFWIKVALHYNAKVTGKKAPGDERHECG